MLKSGLFKEIFQICQNGWVTCDGQLEIIILALMEDILCTLKFNPLQNQQMVNLDATDVHRHLTHWQNLRPIVTVTRSI